MSNQALTPQPHPLNTDFTWHDHHGPRRRLTEQQVQQFDEQGFVLVECLFDAATIATVRDEIDRFEVKSEEFLQTMPDGTMFIATAGQITFTIHLVAQSSIARQFAQHPGLVDVCHDLIGPDVRLYWDQAVYKKQEPTREFPWHQDNGYAFVEPQEYLTCWVPLTDATVDNGCPWVMPGMHRGGTLVHHTTPVGFQCLFDSDGAVPVEAPVGSAVVFSSLTPHRTGPNITEAVRKSYILQYAPDGAEVIDQASRSRAAQRDPARQFSVLVNGQPVDGR